MEQLSIYQSAHIDYIGSDALSTALAVYLGPLPPELRLEFINEHWSKRLKERGIELSWSSTEKVLPSVIGQSVLHMNDGESPAAAPDAPVANGDTPVADGDNTDDGDVVNTTSDEKADDDIGMSTCV